MRRTILLLTALALLPVPLQPAAAQSFFERLFGPPRDPNAPRQGYQPQPQYRPRPQPRPQQRRPQQPPPQPQPDQQQAEPAPPVEPPPAPYEKELLRLAEIMGALAMLRPLCTAPDAHEWSRRMQILLETEGTTPGRRERLAGAYNKGYQAYALTYRICTPSAQEASARFIHEGEELARNITSRYGG
ncbi:TIGR02301 family protein [Microvirga makkahensis]|uniref:TIGR02301 family protein n=1 Tax=Microvirga makkahensis TaxID=1128670 RepID=UPI0014781A0B|nr:TIGR02301 family protein [Microvirga makkahensis]